MNEHQEFDEALRRWATRSPATKASEAARAVVAAIERPGGRLKFFSPAAAVIATASLVLAVGTALFMRSLPSREEMAGNGSFVNFAADEGQGKGSPHVTPVQEGDADVVLWLDDGTPVYVYLPDTQAMR